MKNFIVDNSTNVPVPIQSMAFLKGTLYRVLQTPSVSEGREVPLALVPTDDAYAPYASISTQTSEHRSM